MKISAVIPVLNELNHLPATIAALTDLALHEIIFVDGGSTDGSHEFLQKQKHVLVLEAERGRGRQMNAGARLATGDVLLFLHCDCTLPPDTVDAISAELANQKVVAGCFLVRFVERSTSLRIVAWGINRRTLLGRTATGDQAIFLRRSVFDATGGFAPWPLFEDIELVSRVKRLGRFAVVRTPVIISARRWLARGVWRTTFRMYALRAGYYAGISPFKLKSWFEDVRTA